LAAFAQLLGAGPNSAGDMGDLVSEQMNGWFTQEIHEYRRLTFERKYGKVADPAGAGPRIIQLSPREKTPGSKTMKIKYGPYLVPNAGHKNRVEEEGMLSNYADIGVLK
jgi:hypothetical protein